MAQLTVRRLDSDLVYRLKLRAARSNRSAEAEHRAILEAALQPKSTEFWNRAARLRDATRGRDATDSVELIRQDRDRGCTAQVTPRVFFRAGTIRRPPTSRPLKERSV